MTDQRSSDLASLRIDRGEHGSPPSSGGGLKRFLVPIVVVAAIGAAGYVGWIKLEGTILKQE